MRNIFIKCLGIFATISVLLLSGCGSGNNKNCENCEWQLAKSSYDYENDGSIDQYCEYRYNNWGIKEKKVFNDNGFLSWNTIYEYNETGNNILTTEWEDYWKDFLVDVNEYDENNHLVLIEKDIWADGINDFTISYTYNGDELTQIIKEIQSPEEGFITIQTNYLYDENSKVIEITEKRTQPEISFTLTSKITYSMEFNEKIILEEQSYSDDDNYYTWQIIKEYDENGEILSDKIHYNSWKEYTDVKALCGTAWVSFKMTEDAGITMQIMISEKIPSQFSSLYPNPPSETKYTNYYNKNGKLTNLIQDYYSEECYSINFYYEGASQTAGQNCYERKILTYRQYDSAGNEIKTEVDNGGDGVIDSVTYNYWKQVLFDQ